MTPDSTVTLRSEDAVLCQSLLERSVASLRDSSLTKFLNLFYSLQSKIYRYPNISMDVDQNEPLSQSIHMPSINPQASMMANPDHALDSHAVTDLPFGSDGLETYLTQVSNIFDNEAMDTDEMLSAWYGSLLEDAGDSGMGPSTTI